MSTTNTDRINKGLRVHITTTNGGAIDGVLSSDYTPSYGVSIEELPVEISPWRIVSVELLADEGVPSDARIEAGLRRFFDAEAAS